MIGKRLKEERERLGLKQPEFSEIAGAKKRTLIDWEQGVSSPTAVQLSALSTIGVDVQYVLTGIRSINREGEKATEKLSASYCVGETRQDYAEIPHFDVRVAAGHGSINTHEELLRPLAFRTDWLKSRNLSTKDLVVVDVCGDSMEPYLGDGDLVLVDRSQVEIATGKTYVLQIDGHLFVKNLQLIPNGLVQVASFNPGFPPYQIDLTNESLNLAVIGRVIASMHEW